LVAADEAMLHSSDPQELQQMLGHSAHV